MPNPSPSLLPSTLLLPGIAHAAADVLTAMRDHLVSVGVVRKPSVAGSQPLMWLEPMQGLRGPKKANDPNIHPTEDSTDLVLGAYVTGGVAPGRFESWWRQPIVDVRYRGWDVRSIQRTELAISYALIDKVDWTMGGLQVVESEQWRALQRLGSDDQGYEFVSSYRFVLYRT